MSTTTPTSKVGPVASETASGFKDAIVIPSMSVEGRINDIDKPEIHVKTYADATLLHITAEGNKTGAFSIDVDLHRLVGLNDKTHDAPIPTDVFHGTVDGVHSPTGRFQHPTEEGWDIRFDCAAVPPFWCAVHVTVEKVSAAVYEEKLSGIKRSIDAVEEESPVNPRGASADIFVEWQALCVAFLCVACIPPLSLSSTPFSILHRPPRSQGTHFTVDKAVYDAVLRFFKTNFVRCCAFPLPGGRSCGCQETTPHYVEVSKDVLKRLKRKPDLRHRVIRIDGGVVGKNAKSRVAEGTTTVAAILRHGGYDVCRENIKKGWCDGGKQLTPGAIFGYTNADGLEGFDMIDVKATPTIIPPPPSPVDATPSPTAPSSQPPKLARTMSCAV